MIKMFIGAIVATLILASASYIAGCEKPSSSIARSKQAVSQYYPVNARLSERKNHGAFIDTRNGVLSNWGPYIRAYFFYDGLARVQHEDGVGYINRDGQFVIPPTYITAGDFVDGVAVAKDVNTNRYGLIDLEGKWLIEPSYDSMSIPSPTEVCGKVSVNLIRAQHDGRFGFIDRTGNTQIPFEFDRLFRFSDGLAAAQGRSSSQSNLWGFIDTDGNYVIEPTYDVPGSFFDGRASVQMDGHWGMIDKSGQVIIEFEHDGISRYCHGRAFIYNSSDQQHNTPTVWLVNGNGERIGGRLFSDAKPFSDGLAAVRQHQGTLWGFINPEGEYVIDPQYKDADSFHQGGALVATRKGQRYLLIDKEATVIWSHEVP